ncbi:MAG: hypothetical protein JWQ49_634, partial [Edaphobacter sp.]|nr:hypothetical protein [Edaphobacter sp.]
TSVMFGINVPWAIRQGAKIARAISFLRPLRSAGKNHQMYGRAISNSKELLQTHVTEEPLSDLNCLLSCIYSQ